MKRVLFHLACVLSVLLCLAAAAAWVGGTGRLGWLLVPVRHHRLMVLWEAGYVGFNWAHGVLPDWRGPALGSEPDDRARQWSGDIGWAWPAKPIGFATDHNWAGFGWTAGKLDNGYWYVEMNGPCWCLILVGSVVPCIAGWRRLRSARRARAGQCVRCGYDLRATPGRCPECGAQPIGAVGSMPT